MRTTRPIRRTTMTRGGDAVRYREPGVEIHSFEAITDEYGGTNDSWWGQATLHVKAQDHDCPYVVANELIGARLAAGIGLPTLPGEVATLSDGRIGWATPQIRYRGVTPPPAYKPDDVLNLYGSVAAGALVFDCWIQNIDRTIENFLFHPSLGIWLIDHEHSLAGRRGEGLKSVPTPSTTMTAHAFRGMPMNDTDLQYWIQRVRTIPRDVIELPLDEAHARGLLGAKPNAVHLRKLLLARQAEIESLVNGLMRIDSAAIASVTPIRTVGNGQVELPYRW